MRELNWRLYCVALHYIPAILIRWEGLGTRSVPPLFVRHSSHTPIVTYLPWMTISNANMLFCNMHCIDWNDFSVFSPFSSNFPYMVESQHGSRHIELGILTLRRISATSPQQKHQLPVGSGQVSGGKHLSAQVKVHNFVKYITSLRVLSLANSLSRSQGSAKPESILWKW